MQNLFELDERIEFDAQVQCQAERDAVLDSLAHVVAWSHVTPSEKAHLLLGLEHLRAHIHCETNGMHAEMTGRSN